MRKLIFLILLLIPITSALQFSPTSLEFNLEKNQISCKKINFEVESQTTIKDVWAQFSSQEWSISNFQTSSQTHGISISYPNEINPNQKEIEVCLSGSKPGSYRGTLVFRQGEVGNSIVQFAVWLKVSISGETNERPIENKTSSSKSSGSSGGSSNNIVWTSQSSTEPSKENFQEINYNFPQNEIKLSSKNTNPLPQQNKLAPSLLLALSMLLIIFLVLLFVKAKR